jgi:AcrR family transcriptional regulator
VSTPDQPPKPTPRRRDKHATRQAILDAAVDSFCRFGYDGVGVREIAADAGVTAMLVSRYFGSKEGLFEEVVEIVLGPPSVIPEDPADLPRRTASALVAASDPAADDLNPFQLTLLSTRNSRAAEIVRAAMLRHVVARLTHLMPGELAQERAEIVLSLVIGLWTFRKAFATPGLLKIPPAYLERQLEAMFRVVMEEP